MRCSAIARHEHVADGVVAGLGQLDVERLRMTRLQEFVRDLHQDAGAVAGQRVGARGAAMGRGSRESAMPCSTILWLGRPLRSATKPTPQASCSRFGS